VDLWVLDLRRCGACRREFPGQVKPLEYHFSDNFDEYFEEINIALETMKEKNYRSIVGYSHSTGGPILLNYLKHSEKKDSQFSGFIFNSPFLDWDRIGNKPYQEGLMEAILPAAVNMGVVDEHKALTQGGSTTNLNTWQMRVHSFYDFDPRIQTLYQLNITAGWMAAATKVHNEIQNCPFIKPYTQKPFLVLTSRHDKCLKDDEIMDFSRRIGPRKSLIQMEWAEHDVIGSYDRNKVIEAMNYITAWLTSSIE